MYGDALPARVRVLILGGGIHGVGVLHDMASRKWADIHLVEKAKLGHGASSRSTKLIHGGLKYLRRLRDFGLVAEALKERRILMDLLPDLVRPVEFLFPILKSYGRSNFAIKSALTLYDQFAGRLQISPHRKLLSNDIADKVSILNAELFSRGYSFWDAQTDDLGLVQRTAVSARTLGGGITEGAKVIRLIPSEDGWDVLIKLSNGELQTVSALYVVNALGPWANQILEESSIKPTHRGINSKGIHLLLPDLGLQSALLLQAISDNRIVSMLPWQGFTLVGTTEDLYPGNPDEVGVKEQDIRYLLDSCNRYLRQPLLISQIIRVFAGLRWTTMESGYRTDHSRVSVVGERNHRRGLLMTLYGGQLTTYRNLSRIIGDRITSHFGEFRESRTHLAESWTTPASPKGSGPEILNRFQLLRM